jgi:hypothetical protein
MALKCKNNEFFVMPLKHILSVMGLVDHPKFWEQLVALQARKDAMTCFTEDLFLGAQEAYSALWPGVAVAAGFSIWGLALELEACSGARGALKERKAPS